MKTLLEQKDYKIMPWKNGRGSTTEICIEPAQADFSKGDFIWRLSSAKVEADGPFSKFPGYDRLLFILSGDGLRLGSRNLLRHESIMFHGEEDIECRLIQDPVVDLGLIFNRNQVCAEFKVVSLTQNTHLSFHTGTHFVRPLSYNIFTDGIPLPESSLLKIEGEGNVSLRALSYPAQFLLISINKRNPPA